MTRGPSAAKIKRVVSAAKKGGMARVKLEIDGEKIVVTEIAATSAEPQNDLDNWRTKRARSA
jgi:hypothetical protein